MEHPTVPLPSKHPRPSDYEGMRKLTESYLRKIKRTLQDQSGGQAAAVQQYFAFDQLPIGSVDIVSRTSVLAFVMHAAEVAVAKLAENREELEKSEVASQPTQDSLPDSVLGLSTEPKVLATVEGVHEAAAPVAKPTIVLRPKAIFKTEQGREDESKAVHHSNPPVPLPQSISECDYSSEQYRTQASDIVPCPIFGCEELFEDHSELLLHMRSAHSS